MSSRRVYEEKGHLCGQQAFDACDLMWLRSLVFLVYDPSLDAASRSSLLK